MCDGVYEGIDCMRPRKQNDESADDADAERDVTVRLEGGGLYIYDTENREAWIQSGSAAELERMA